MIKRIQVLILAMASLLLAARIEAATVTVFAAASLMDVLKQAAADYEKQSGDKIVFNFAASGTLARQIETGAPADLFFSADEAKADQLERKGLIVPDSRRNLLGNALVIVTALDTPGIHSPEALTNVVVKRLAIGDEKTVPAGAYARAYLEKAGLWTAIKSKIIPCENVRAVLAAVESGNVDAGIVYKTDAAISKKVKLAVEIPAAVGPKITYPVALLKEAPQPKAAAKFLRHLQSAGAAKAFEEAGFIVLAADTGK